MIAFDEVDGVLPKGVYKPLTSDDEKRISDGMKSTFHKIYNIIIRNNTLCARLVNDILTDKNITVIRMTKMISSSTRGDVTRIIGDFERFTRVDNRAKIEIMMRNRLNPKYIAKRYSDNKTIKKHLTTYETYVNEMVCAIYPMIYWYVNRNLRRNNMDDQKNKLDIVDEIVQDTTMNIIKKAYKYDNLYGKWTTYAYTIMSSSLGTWYKSYNKSYVKKRMYESKIDVETIVAKQDERPEINIDDFCSYLRKMGSDNRDIEALRTYLGLTTYKTISDFATGNKISKERGRQLKDRAIEAARSKYLDYVKSSQI